MAIVGENSFFSSVALSGAIRIAVLQHEQAEPRGSL
jgi:hypothetical protein